MYIYSVMHMLGSKLPDIVMGMMMYDNLLIMALLTSIKESIILYEYRAILRIMVKMMYFESASNRCIEIVKAVAGWRCP